MSCAVLHLNASESDDSYPLYIHCPQTELLFWLHSKGTFNAPNVDQASILQSIKQYAGTQDNGEIQDSGVQNFFAWYCKKRLCNLDQKFWIDLQHAKSNTKKKYHWKLSKWRSPNEQVQNEINVLGATITCYNAWQLITRILQKQGKPLPETSPLYSLPNAEDMEELINFVENF